MRRHVPINHPATAIDQAFAVKIDKNPQDGADITIIEGITLPRPIAGTAQTLELFDNNSTMFVLPIHDSAKEFLPAQIMARFFLRLSQMFFNRSLSAHAGVIGPGQPEHFKPVHPGPSGQHILDRVIQNMTKRQDAGNVRWRYDD